MKEVTDPALIAELEGDGGKAVTDPELLALLEGVDPGIPVPGHAMDAPSKPAEAPTSMLDKAGKFARGKLGDLEAGGALLTGMVGAIPGMVLGGANAAVRQAMGRGGPGFKEGAMEGASALTRTPRTPDGKEALNSVQEALSASKLEGLGPTGGMLMGGLSGSGKLAGPALRQTGAAAGKAAGSVAELAAGLGKSEDSMVGVGSALTAADKLRMARAEGLPIPIKLTKGQASRIFEQQQFERETAKNQEAGAPLRERFAEQNEKILKNFDAWVDETGAKAGGLRETGHLVDAALVSKAKKAKGEINAAYAKARAAGEMNDPVPIQTVLDYLDKNQSQAINAPVLKSAKDHITDLSKKTPGVVSINDLEEVRKSIGVAGGKDATNAHYAKELKGLIDGLTEGRGGAEYKRARALRTRYAAEFEDVGVIDKLLSKKPGSKDRAVAYEDVFSHSILKGSLDDVRAVRKTLQTAGDEGKQAWKELQGATIQHIKDEITKNVATDTGGNRIVSAARLDRLVTELDADGKLDYVFGKKAAQQIRDVTELSKDVYTSPPGSVNTSNTASILIGLLDSAISGTAGMPVPIGTALSFGVKQIKKRALDKRVQAALNPQDAANRAGIGQ
jgi:hypothetical protein